MSPGFSDSIKLPCSPHAFFLVIVCLRSFCSYDSPRPSSSMKLSPSCRARPPFTIPSHRDPPIASCRRHLSPPIPLHPYCRCNPRAIQRNLVSSRRLFPTFAGSQLSTPRLSNSVKTLPCSISLLCLSLSLPYFSFDTFPRLPPRANIIPRNITLPVFIRRPFSASRPSTYIENNSSLVPVLTRFLPGIFAHVMSHITPPGDKQ